MSKSEQPIDIEVVQEVLAQLPSIEAICKTQNQRGKS